MNKITKFEIGWEPYRLTVSKDSYVVDFAIVNVTPVVWMAINDEEEYWEDWNFSIVTDDEEFADNKYHVRSCRKLGISYHLLNGGMTDD